MAHRTGDPILHPHDRSALAGGSTTGDDQILPETRWAGACIPPFLIVAFIMLYFFPGHTKELFAWTINPPMTPLLMGAGYIAGSYFFVRLAMGGKWHRFTLGFLPITTFTWFMGLATVLHWDKFNHAHISFYVWLALYVVTPFLVPALWLRNRATDPGTLAAGDVEVPLAVRWVAGVSGGALLLIALFMFVVPTRAIGVWPWKLTPLTARVVAGWFALTGVTGIRCATDRRWSAWRIILESQIIGIALILVGVARAWGDFDPKKATTAMFVVGLSMVLAFFVGIHVCLDAQRRKAVVAVAR
jgi:hypothetical protein